MGLRKPLGVFLLFVLILVIDQVSKLVASNYLQTVCNRGSAFGLSPAYSILILPILVFLTIVLVCEKKEKFYYPLALILAGGFSNLVDRIRLECVVDFINLGFFPSFNFADIAISLGVIFSVYFTFNKS